jgi:hypothetical protein
MIVCSCNVLSDRDVRSTLAAAETPRKTSQVYDVSDVSATWILICSIMRTIYNYRRINEFPKKTCESFCRTTTSIRIHRITFRNPSRA